MTVRIGYYRCGVTKGRNAEWPIHVLYDDVQWPTNVLRQRGLLNRRRLVRDADEEEQACAQNNRLQSYKYKTLADLIEDESRRPDITAEFLASLTSAFSDLSPEGTPEISRAAQAPGTTPASSRPGGTAELPA